MGATNSIAEVLATTRFESGEELAETLRRYVYLYNQQIPQQGTTLPVHIAVDVKVNRVAARPIQKRVLYSLSAGRAGV